jgi:acetylornithine/succinyldiaminopimelate/putrescine aminotransferase
MIKKFKNGSFRISGNDTDNFIRNLRGDDKIELFNTKYKVGDKVIVLDDNGNEFTDIVKNPATIMGGHTPMAWLERKGSYRIERVIRKSQ